MSDVQTYDLAVADGSEYEKRVVCRCHKLALDIINEDPATLLHAERLTWAYSVRINPVPMAQRMKWAVLNDAYVLAAEIPGSTADDGWREAKIEAAVSALINQFAA
jgi:hypothetical protein